jgi:hypothetical protein
MESQNGMESPEDRRSALWHGNQHVCERHPQVSRSAISRYAAVDLPVTTRFRKKESVSAFASA